MAAIEPRRLPAELQPGKTDLAPPQADPPSRSLAALRHAMGQPLTVIQGFSELIAGGTLNPEEIQEYAAAIFTEAVQLAEIVARTRDE